MSARTRSARRFAGKSALSNNRLWRPFLSQRSLDEAAFGIAYGAYQSALCGVMTFPQASASMSMRQRALAGLVDGKEWNERSVRDSSARL